MEFVNRETKSLAEKDFIKEIFFKEPVIAVIKSTDDGEVGYVKDETDADADANNLEVY